jgi:hypothetical protein
MQTVDGGARLPELGTPEAAVQSCVNLLAMLFSQPVADVERYLDLYYQVRTAYERADGAGSGDRKGRPYEKEGAEAKEQPSSECRTLPARQDAPPRESTLSGFEPVAVSRKSGAPKGNTNGKAAAEEKRRIRERLLTMRQNGLTTPEVLKAGNGCIEEASVWEIIEGKLVPVSVYRVLDGILDVIEGAAKS